MPDILPPWLLWSLLSALFAALTAILAKIGVAGISADVATLIRTVVIGAMTAVLVAATGQWPASAAALGTRSVVFLILSGLATGASWLCYFRALKLGDAARVAPIDKLSVVLVAVMGVVLLGEQLAPRHVAGIALIALGAVLVAT
jgi:transporter family protein